MTKALSKIPPARSQPSAAEAEQAVRILLQFIGEDPYREGLKDTPKRVIEAYREYFSGYGVDPETYLNRFFQEVENYQDMVLLRDIDIASHCEHHLAPITGFVHMAYLPSHRVVGISKLVRLAEMYARRLQIQEKLTAQISNALESVLKPRGTAVLIEATHHCMTTRGVQKRNVVMVTSRYTGAFEAPQGRLQNEFLRAIGK